MPLKSHKPTTPSRRHMVLSDFSEITKSSPERSLLKGKRVKRAVIVRVVFRCVTEVADTSVGIG